MFVATLVGSTFDAKSELLNGSIRAPLIGASRSVIKEGLETAIRLMAIHGRTNLGQRTCHFVLKWLRLSLEGRSQK